MRTTAELRKPGSEHIAIQRDASAADAVASFQAHPGLRILPVLDEKNRPVGAIFEEDVRQILFNPYGHALLHNPSFGATLAQWIRRCPFAELSTPLGELLTLYAEAGGQEGVILTANGRYHGVIENRELVSAAGAYEQHRLHERERQIDALRETGSCFEGEIRDLVQAFGQLAAKLESAAIETAQRGEETGRRATIVATAANQTGNAMSAVASQGGQQVNSLDQLQAETSKAKLTAARAVALVAAGAMRSETLQDSTRSIERITGLIDALAGKVNMLAINATIEAARAGEAGRGFAIVASEVKGLAGQTRAAAEEIRTHSIDVRRAADDVAAGHGGIEEVIVSVENIARSVDETVQAQRAMTLTIADGAEQAASASHDIQYNVQSIHGSAIAAANGASEMRDAAQELAVSSQRLGQRVDAFLVTVRAAA